MIGEGEVPDSPLLGVGVRSTDVTEQLRARERIVDAGEIGLSKRTAGPSRPAMNMLGEEGLPRSRLPFEENERLVHGREATKTPKHRAKCRTHRAQIVHPLPSTQALWRLVVRCGDGSQLERRYSGPSRVCHVDGRADRCVMSIRSHFRPKAPSRWLLLLTEPVAQLLPWIRVRSVMEVSRPLAM